MIKKRLSKAKKNKSLLTVIALILFFMLSALVIYQIYLGSESKRIVQASMPECTKNSDCIILRGSCCSCDNGGAPKCIAKTKLADYTKELESCSSDGNCIGADCGTISCGCVKGSCVGNLE